MKVWSVFSLVILFHFAIISLLFIQPGCQSQPAEVPDPAITEPATRTSGTGGSQPLDPAFNSGVSQPSAGVASARKRNLTSPTRPTTQQRADPDTGVLQPVTDPVRDTFSLPPVNREYTVEKGDTLSGIALKEGVSLSALLSANGLTRNSVIYVGQSLLIPEARTGEDPSSAEIAHAGREVVVAGGDSLSAIAARNGTTVNAIKALNGLTSDTIRVGQVLAIPESGSAPSGSATSGTSTPIRSLSAGLSTYTVKAGDTPSGIAKRFGITARELMAENNITDPRRLYVGRELVIPGGGGDATPPGEQLPSTATPTTRQSSGISTTTTSSSTDEEVYQDPIESLESLNDDDLPFVEVEAVEEDSEPRN